MFLGGNTNIPAGSGQALTLNRDELAVIAGGLGDGYFGDKDFWREVIVSFEAGSVYTEGELVVDGDTDNSPAGAWFYDIGGSIGTSSPDGYLRFGYQQAHYEYQTITGFKPGETYQFNATNSGHAGADAYPTMQVDRGAVFSWGMTGGINSRSFVATSETHEISFYVAAYAIASAQQQVTDVSIIGPRPYGTKTIGQRVNLVYTDSDSALAVFSPNAMIGEWTLRSITIIDKDQGRFVIEPHQIPNIELYKLNIQ